MEICSWCSLGSLQYCYLISRTFTSILYKFIISFFQFSPKFPAIGLLLFLSTQSQFPTERCDWPITFPPTFFFLQLTVTIVFILLSFFLMTIANIFRMFSSYVFNIQQCLFQLSQCIKNHCLLFPSLPPFATVCHLASGSEWLLSTHSAQAST